MGKEQRRDERFDALNLLHYRILNPEAGQIGDGMGRTLNVSKGGILLETSTPFAEGQEVAVSIGIEEDLVEVCGMVVHCKPSGEHLFSSGLRFENLDEAGQRVLANYLKLFQKAPRR